MTTNEWNARTALHRRKWEGEKKVLLATGRVCGAARGRRPNEGNSHSLFKHQSEDAKNTFIFRCIFLPKEKNTKRKIIGKLKLLLKLKAKYKNDFSLL